MLVQILHRVLIDFNSIKVRLELSFLIADDIVLVFQFHKGTIRTNYHRLIELYSTYFNSIKVRLELLRIFWLLLML